MKSKDVVLGIEHSGKVSVCKPFGFKLVKQCFFSLQIGARYGHCYAYDLIDNLSPKLDIDDGVVRISLVHYNTVEEVELIIQEIEKVLDLN